jgi:hypothetical protein
MHIALLSIGWPGACNAQRLKNFSPNDERKLCPLDTRGRYLKKRTCKNCEPPEQCSRRNPSWAMYQIRSHRRPSS